MARLGFARAGRAPTITSSPPHDCKTVRRSQQDIDGITGLATNVAITERGTTTVGESGHHGEVHLPGLLRKALQPKVLSGNLQRSLTRMLTPTFPLCMIWPLSSLIPLTRWRSRCRLGQQADAVPAAKPGSGSDETYLFERSLYEREAQAPKERPTR